LKTTELTYQEACEFFEYKQNQQEFRNKVNVFEKALAKHCTKTDQDKNLPALQGYEEGHVNHDFADGQYVRTIVMPKDLVIATKIHNQNHPFFVMKGECSVYTEKGMQRIKAPYHGITEAGTKRLLYIHEECTWVTVHCTEKLTLEEIENECIAKDFDKGNFLNVDIKQIDKLIAQAESN
jgi:quercetin dioxygenase-like cupin family protein